VLHAKTAVADGAWSIVGTSNLDYLSFLRNHEVDAVVVGGIFATQMEQIFQDDLERTRQITLAEWRRRPLGYKILGYINYWFEPWL
jgi:cardiolipin synthase